MSERAKRPSAGFALLGLFLIGSAFYYSCFRVTNEIGPIGADKIGRQIFLQSLQYYMGEPLGYSVESEWSDSPLFVRLLVHEPMRTTIRFVSAEGADRPDPQVFVELLEAPYPYFFGQFRTPPDTEIWLREEHSVPLVEFYRQLDQLGASTVQEMFACMGFRRFELHHEGQSLLERDLPEVDRANVKWLGGGH